MSAQITEARLCDAIASEPTLAAAYLPSTESLLHVTPFGVSLWKDVTNGSSQATWSATAGITAASISETYVAVAERGGALHLLQASSESLTVAS